MTVKDRILQFIGEKGISKSEFERRSGLSNGYVNNLKANIGADKLEHILFAFEDLNRVWLLTGEGEMLKSSPSADTPCSHSVDDLLSRIKLMEELLAEKDRVIKLYEQMCKAKI